jgi:hypothetical protein
MRFCHVCLDLKPASEFNRNAKMTSGRLNQCKDCVRIRLRTWRESARERIREKQKAWESLPSSREKMRVRLAAWRSAHPLRRAAQVALGNAKRDGRVVAQLCWVCGSKAEAHHPDYSAPLDVVWLCRPHHKQAHEAAK